MNPMLYWFNPENDMALAHGKSRFVVRNSVRKMRNDLSFLPVWYAQAGSAVWIDDLSRVEPFLAESPFDFPIHFVANFKPEYRRVVPWGWNPSLCRDLKEWGCALDLFPDAVEMDRIRWLSNRETAVDLLRLIKSECGHGFVGMSVVLRSMEEVTGFVRQYGNVMLKAPWSGSGRGVQHVCADAFAEPLSNWVERTLSIQQSVIGELYYNKVLDFAMEFFSAEDGSVRFAGYSLFETDENGAYKRNVLASDHHIEQVLDDFVSLAALHALRDFLETRLSSIIRGVYTGYLGVDMMVCVTEEGYRVHPCVEINMRMNMGVLTRMLFDRYLDAHSTGFFHIEYYPSIGSALSFHQRMKADSPLVLRDGRITSGYLSLTPVDKDTSFQAYIQVNIPH